MKKGGICQKINYLQYMILKMLIENYKVILEYQDVYIRIKTYIGIININGFNLKLSEMTSDDIMVTGDIETIDFEKIED